MQFLSTCNANHSRRRHYLDRGNNKASLLFAREDGARCHGNTRGPVCYLFYGMIKVCHFIGDRWSRRHLFRLKSAMKRKKNPIPNHRAELEQVQVGQKAVAVSQQQGGYMLALVRSFALWLALRLPWNERLRLTNNSGCALNAADWRIQSQCRLCLTFSLAEDSS